MEREILVYVDLNAAPLLVGQLWARVRKNKESVIFEYDKSWLERPHSASRWIWVPVRRAGRLAPDARL